MQRKVIFLPVFIGAILCGCSSDSSDKNPVDTATLPTIGEGDDQGNPLTGFDPNTPYIDPVSGDPLPVIEYTDPTTGETVPAVQYVDSETGDTITVPITLPASSGSTAIAPASSATAQAPTHQDSVTTPEVSMTTSSSAAQPESSSSGLKEYEDTHKAKATFLPKAG